MLFESRIIKTQKGRNFDIILSKTLTKYTGDWFDVKFLSIPDENIIFIRSFSYLTDAIKFYEILLAGDF